MHLDSHLTVTGQGLAQSARAFSTVSRRSIVDVFNRILSWVIRDASSKSSNNLVICVVCRSITRRDEASELGTDAWSGQHMGQPCGLR